MRSLRVVLVLLLVVLLPLRGAVAATMPCSAHGEGPRVTVAVHDHGTQAGHGAHAMHGDHADTGAPDAVGSHDHGKSGHTDTCNLCAGGCHATPLATAPPEVVEPLLSAKLVFPALSFAAPAFQSEGQERPPRSI